MKKKIKRNFFELRERLISDIKSAIVQMETSDETEIEKFSDAARDAIKGIIATYNIEIKRNPELKKKLQRKINQLNALAQALEDRNYKEVGNLFDSFSK